MLSEPPPNDRRRNGPLRKWAVERDCACAGATSAKKIQAAATHAPKRRPWRSEDIEIMTSRECKGRSWPETLKRACAGVCATTVGPQFNLVGERLHQPCRGAPA